MKKSIKILALVLSLALICGALVVASFAGTEEEIAGVTQLIDLDFESTPKTEYGQAAELDSNDGNTLCTENQPSGYKPTIYYSQRVGEASIVKSEYDDTNSFFYWKNSGPGGTSSGNTPYINIDLATRIEKDKNEINIYGKDVDYLIIDVDMRFPTHTPPQHMNFEIKSCYVDGTGAKKMYHNWGGKHNVAPNMKFRKDGNNVVVYCSDSNGGWVNFSNGAVVEGAWNHLTMIVEAVVKTDGNDDAYLELYVYYYLNGEFLSKFLLDSSETFPTSDFYNGDRTMIQPQTIWANFTTAQDANLQVQMDNLNVRAVDKETYTGNLATVLADGKDITEADICGYNPYEMPFGTLVCTNTTTGVNYDSLQKAIDLASQGDEIVLKANVAGTVYANQLVTVVTDGYTVEGFEGGKDAEENEYIVSYDETTGTYTSEYASDDLSVTIDWLGCTCGMDTCDETHPGNEMTTVYIGNSILASYPTEGKATIWEDSVNKVKYTLLGWQDADGNVITETTVVTQEHVDEGYLELTPILGTYVPAYEYERGGSTKTLYSDAKLADAIYLADADTTVTILNDIKIGGTVGVSKNITVDMNGKTIDAVTVNVSKFHLFTVNAVKFTFDATTEGAKIYLGTHMNGEGVKFRSNAIFSSNAAGSDITCLGSGLKTYSALLYMSYGKTAGSFTVDGGEYYDPAGINDNFAYMQFNNLGTATLKNAMFYSAESTILGALGNGDKYITSTLTADNCVFVGTIGNYSYDGFNATFTNCVLAGNLNANVTPPYSSSLQYQAAWGGTWTIGEGCYVKQGATLSSNVVVGGEGLVCNEVNTVKTFTTYKNSFKMIDDATLDPTTYNIVEAEESFTFDKYVSKPVDPITVTWYDTDGSVLGTNTALPGAQATAPAVVIADGWVNAVYTDWKNENGDETTLVPEGATEASFTLVEGSAAAYTANYVPLYVNYDLVTHIQINCYVPVELPEGVTNFEIYYGSMKRTPEGNFTIGGEAYKIAKNWPQAAGADDDTSYTAKFNYNGVSISYTTPVFNIGDYGKIVLEGEYTQATKTAVADLLRYVDAANVAAGRTTNADVTSVLATAPVSELPTITPAEAADLGAVADYVSEIYLKVNTYHGGVQLQFFKSEKAVTDGVKLEMALANGYRATEEIKDVSAADSITQGGAKAGAFWANHSTRLYDFDNTITLTVKDAQGQVIATAQYSLESYCQAVWNEASEAQKNLMLATLAVAASSEEIKLG